MPRARTRVGPDTRPCLPPHVRLREDPVRRRLAVLAPEKVLWPDAVSADILARCDGRRAVRDIARDLAADYAAPADVIEADVTAFLQDWCDRLLIADAALMEPAR